MYGTIARFKVKPGMDEQLKEVSANPEYQQVPGAVAQYVYKLDNSPDEYYIVAIFDSKESYWANATSPEQDARYRQLRELLAEDPDWHDGEVVFASHPR